MPAMMSFTTRGGENTLAILLPEGTTLNDATIGRISNGQGYEIERKAQPRDQRIEFFFFGDGDAGDTVEIIVEDSTGKKITFKPIASPRHAYNYSAQERSIGGYYYERFEFCPGDQDVATVKGIAPPIGETLPRP